MTTSRRAMDGREWLMLLALSLLWGSSFYFFKILSATLPPLTIVLGRVGLSALMLNALLMMRGEPLWQAPRPNWRAFTVLAVLNNVLPFAMFAWSERHIPSGMAGMLNATTPLFSVLLAHLLTQTDRLTWARSAGVLLGMAGVGVLIGPAALHGAGVSLAGDGACILASISYAFGGLFGRRFRATPPLRVATAQVTAATLVTLPLAAVSDHFWSLPPPSAAIWGALAGIALLCTVLAFILYFRVLATAGPTNVVLVTFLVPITALPIGWLFLGEGVPGRAYWGMALIGLGLGAIDGRVFRQASVLFCKKEPKNSYP